MIRYASVGGGGENNWAKILNEFKEKETWSRAWQHAAVMGQWSTSVIFSSLFYGPGKWKRGLQKLN